MYVQIAPPFPTFDIWLLMTSFSQRFGTIFGNTNKTKTKQGIYLVNISGQIVGFSGTEHIPCFALYILLHIIVVYCTKPLTERCQQQPTTLFVDVSQKL